jgi:hypothetical protein
MPYLNGKGGGLDNRRRLEHIENILNPPSASGFGMGLRRDLKILPETGENRRIVF